jgi:hypothetical protein
MDEIRKAAGWRAHVEAAVREFAGESADVKEKLCRDIGARWEAEAEAKARELFAGAEAMRLREEAEERWRAKQAKKIYSATQPADVEATKTQPAQPAQERASKTPGLVAIDGAPLVRRRREWWKEGRVSQLSSSVSQLSSVPQLASSVPHAPPDDELKPELVREVGKLVQLRVKEQAKPVFEDVLDEPKPTSLLPLTGVAADIQERFLETSMWPGPLMSVAAGTMVPATLLAGKVIGPTGARGLLTTLYLILLAGTGAGKEEVLALVKECLGKVAASLIGPNRFKSGPGIIKHLMDMAPNPSVCCAVQDEFGKFLQKLADPRSSSSEQDAMDRLRELIGLQPGTPYITPAGASERSVVLEEVALLLLGAGVEDDFFAACGESWLVNGSLNRFVVLNEKPRPPRNKNPSVAPFPKALVENLQKLYQIKPMRLEWGSPGARDIYEAEADRVEKLEEGPELQLCVRGPEQIVKFASVYAGARFARVITREDMEIAWKIVKEHSQPAFWAGMEQAAERKVLSHAEILRQLEYRLRTKWPGYASLAQLKRSFRHNKSKARALDEALQDALASGLLTFIPELGTEGRSLEKVYKLTDYKPTS